MTVLRSGSATDVGRVRSSNQDVALEEPDLFAVADGMGGHVGGEVAARIAVDTLRTAFQRLPTVEGLRQAFAEANRAVWRQGQSDSGLRGMGTTLTATALVRDPGGRSVIALANVGDSRAYVFSRGQVIQITADHSLAEERVRQGEMTEAEAAVHPHRHILTRALGVSSDVDVDLWELHLSEADRILLCSDGLTNEVDDDRIGEILGSVRDPQKAASVLVRAAVDHGGNDNVTVVVVDIVSTAEPSGSADGRTTQLPVVGAVPGDEPTTMVSGQRAGVGAGDRIGGIEVGAPEEGASEVTGVLPAVKPGGPGGSSAVGGSRSGSATGRTGAETAVVTAGRSRGAVAENGQGGERATEGQGLGSVQAGRPLGSASGTGQAPRATGTPSTAGFGSQAAELRRLRPSRKERRRRRRAAGIPRMITVRVVLFVILLLAVVGAAYALVRWYAMDDWYVGVEHQHLAVYQGRPGGFLWFQPKLVDETSVTTSGVLPFHLPALRADHQEPSATAARRYVHNLHQEYLATKPATNGTTSTGSSSATGSPTSTGTSSSTSTTAASG